MVKLAGFHDYDQNLYRKGELRQLWKSNSELTKPKLALNTSLTYHAI
jgi:hypothetical protein